MTISAPVDLPPEVADGFGFFAMGTVYNGTAKAVAGFSAALDAGIFVYPVQTQLLYVAFKQSLNRDGSMERDDISFVGRPRGRFEGHRLGPFFGRRRVKM